MQSVRAIILRKYTRQLEALPEGSQKERVKQKIYNFLQRCKMHDTQKKINRRERER